MTISPQTPPDGTPNTSPTWPPWRQPDWNGPTVETRPDNADLAEWPEGAVERVVFTPENVPTTFPACLPYTEYFGDDGWPLHCPDKVKRFLDRRLQAELRLLPWTSRPEAWNEGCWLSVADYDEFRLLNAQAGLVRSTVLNGALPGPSAGA